MKYIVYWIAGKRDGEILLNPSLNGKQPDSRQTIVKNMKTSLTQHAAVLVSATNTIMMLLIGNNEGGVQKCKATN